MGFFVIILIFLGSMVALYVCLIALIGGIALASESMNSNSLNEKEEIIVEDKNRGIKVAVKLSIGILIALAGLAGVCFVMYYSWHTLWKVLVFVMGGAAILGTSETVSQTKRYKRYKRKCIK